MSGTPDRGGLTWVVSIVRIAVKGMSVFPCLTTMDLKSPRELLPCSIPHSLCPYSLLRQCCL